jgi:AcrR family transcriptional regulator
MARISVPGRATKGERTRQRIVERAAAVFNTRGVAGASMADISFATGLEKGGVYNHFETKDHLALAAFDYAAGLVRSRLEAAMAKAPGPLERLYAMLEVYRNIGDVPFVAGGCPLLNTAIEADDTHPALRDRVRRAMSWWQRSIAGAVEEAIAAGELVEVEPAALASTMIALLEGAIMLSSLYRDGSHMKAAIDHLARHLAGLTPERALSR